MPLLWLAVLPACGEYALEKVTDATTAFPVLAVDPDRLDFGALPLGGSATLPLTVRNEGNVTLDLDRMDLSGTGAASFTVVDAPDDLTLAPATEARFDVVFTAQGSDESATLTVRSDDPVRPAVAVALTGSALFPLLVVDPDPVDFGNTAPGGVVPLSATLRNDGTDVVDVTLLTVTAAPFSLAAELALPRTFAPGEQAAVDLLFAPTEEGRFEGTLWLASTDAAGSHAVQLLGSAGEQYAEEEERDPECYEPEDAWEEHPGARLVVLEGDLAITTTYLGTEAGYTNELWLLEPEEIRLAIGHVDAVGATTTFGPYAEGTELTFAIRVRDTGDEWQTGPASGNADGEIHAAVTYTGACTWTLGFEDTYGGGDQDFDDISLSIAGELRQDG